MTAKNWITLLMTAVALLVTASTFWTPAPGFDQALHEEIANKLVAETLSFLKPGGRVTVVARDTEAFRQPAMKLLLDKVVRRLQKAGASVRSVEPIQLDPIRPSQAPPGDLYELMRRAPAGDVIISLLGPPVLLPDQKAKIGRPKARIVALCIGVPAHATALTELFTDGLLHAAIVSKPPGSATGSLKAHQFDQLYTLMRQSNDEGGGSL